MWSKERSDSGVVGRHHSAQAAITSIKEVTDAAVGAIKETATKAIHSIKEVVDPMTAGKGKGIAKPVVAFKDAEDIVTDTKAKDPIEPFKGKVDLAVLNKDIVESVVTTDSKESTTVDITALKDAADTAMSKLQAAGNADVVDLKDAVTAAIAALKTATKTATLSQKESVPFPKIIWQIWQTKPGGPTAAEVKVIYADLIKSWTSMNPGWSYAMVDDDEANRIITDRFRDEHGIRDMFLTLTDPILRADLLRLLLLYSDGGLYLDLDTKCTKPIDEWGLDHLTQADGVRLVVGVERDLLEGDKPAWWTDIIQFNNWTLAARPGSPLLKKVIFKIMDNLVAMAAQQGQTLAELVPAGTDVVLEGTGPVAITRAICKVFEETTGKQHIWHSDFNRIIKPYAFHNELLVYPKVCMAKEPVPGEQPYDPEVFLQHKFHHSWMQSKNVKAKEVQQLLEKGH